jgi:hypothetical protein
MPNSAHTTYLKWQVKVDRASSDDLQSITVNGHAMVRAVEHSLQGHIFDRHSGWSSSGIGCCATCNRNFEPRSACKMVLQAACWQTLMRVNINMDVQERKSRCCVPQLHRFQVKEASEKAVIRRITTYSEFRS